MTRSTLLGEAGFPHVFPERGESDGAILSALGLTSEESVVQVRQVHGARVVEARDAPGSEGDALIARAAAGRIAVGVRVADCVPVLVGSPDTGDVAAIHAGWRGVVAGVVRTAVAGLDGRGLLAAIGPCIGACCFEVGRDVADEIARASPGVNVIAARPPGPPPAIDKALNKAHVDLRAAVRAQLRAAGLDDARIDDVSGCTRHEAARFHSFRRDGANSGRMLASIVTKPRREP
jgi:hypothetical protein